MQWLAIVVFCGMKTVLDHQILKIRQTYKKIFLSRTNPPVVKKGTFYFYRAAFVILTSIYNHV